MILTPKLSLTWKLWGSSHIKSTNEGNVHCHSPNRGRYSPCQSIILTGPLCKTCGHTHIYNQFRYVDCPYCLCVSYSNIKAKANPTLQFMSNHNRRRYYDRRYET